MRLIIFAHFFLNIYKTRKGNSITIIGYSLRCIVSTYSWGVYKLNVWIIYLFSVSNLRSIRIFRASFRSFGSDEVTCGSSSSIATSMFSIDIRSILQCPKPTVYSFTVTCLSEPDIEQNKFPSIATGGYFGRISNKLFYRPRLSFLICQFFQSKHGGECSVFLLFLLFSLIICKTA